MTHKFDSNEEILQHFGIKGMQWGVRREENRKGAGGSSKTTSKAKSKTTVTKSKLENHPAVKKHGHKEPTSVLKRMRAMEAKMDVDHVDVNGNYTNNGALAKTTRVVDRTLDVAGVLTVAGVFALTAM